MEYEYGSTSLPISSSTYRSWTAPFWKAHTSHLYLSYACIVNNSMPSAACDPNPIRRYASWSGAGAIRPGKIPIRKCTVGKTSVSSSQKKTNMSPDEKVPHIPPMPRSPSASITRSRSCTVFAFFEMPRPPRAPFFFPPPGGGISTAETGVAAPDGFALASSKCPSPKASVSRSSG
jgi:hypothetical protein